MRDELRRAIGAIGLTLLGAGVLNYYLNRPPDYAVERLAWQVGRADVSGSVTNHTDRGCSQVGIHVVQRDKNDAIFKEDDLEAGSVDAGQTRIWSGTLRGILIASPIDPAVVQVIASANCLDRH